MPNVAGVPSRGFDALDDDRHRFFLVFVLLAFAVALRLHLHLQLKLVDRSVAGPQRLDGPLP